MLPPFSHSTRIAPPRAGWVGEFFLALLEGTKRAARIQEKLMSHMKDCTRRSCLIKTCTEEKVFPVKGTKGKLEKIWITEFPAVCKRGALLIPNALPAVVECFVRKRKISFRIIR